MQISYQAI
jgi:hypothetical protein